MTEDFQISIDPGPPTESQRERLELALKNAGASHISGTWILSYDDLVELLEDEEVIEALTFDRRLSV